MADILQEIKHDIAEEKYQRIFLEHGKKLIIAAVIIILVVTAKTIYYNIQEKKALEVGSLFIEAFDSSEAGDYDAIIARGQKGFSPLALLMKAGLQNVHGKYDDAIGTLETLEKSSYDKAFIDIARLNKAYLLIQKKGDKKTILSLLDEETAEGAPFKATALELKASYILSLGDSRTAVQIYQQLAVDREIPATIQERAKNVLGTINE